MTDTIIRVLEDLEELFATLSMSAKTRNQLLGWLAGTRQNLGIHPAQEDDQRKRRIRSAAERIVCMSTDTQRSADELAAKAVEVMKAALAK